MTTLPKKILIVRLGALGDVANALVLAAAIKRAAPDTFVGWAVHNLALPIVEGNPVVDRAYLWDKKLGVRGLIFWVLGFDRARTKEFAWLFLNESIAPLPDPAYKPRHMVEQYLEFATHLGIEASAEHRLPQNDQAVAWAAEQVDRLARAPVAIGIGASYVSKSWPAERFLDLGRSVAASLNRPVILLGGPGDRELARLELEQLAAASSDDGDDSHQPVVDFVGRTSLAELIAITARAAVFVSCDTGPMHLAVAQGIPVVALFGPGVAGRTGPYNPQPARHEIVAVPPPCAPCNKRTCRMPRHDCMLDIGVELALDAVQRQLERVDAQSS